MTLHLQCSQIGAMAWIAHSKLSNVCRAPAVINSKALSYSLPQTSHFAIPHLAYSAVLFSGVLPGWAEAPINLVRERLSRSQHPDRFSSADDVQRYTASRAHVIEPEVELLLCLTCSA